MINVSSSDSNNILIVEVHMEPENHRTDQIMSEATIFLLSTKTPPPGNRHQKHQNLNTLQINPLGEKIIRFLTFGLFHSSPTSHATSLKKLEQAREISAAALMAPVVATNLLQELAEQEPTSTSIAAPWNSGKIYFKCCLLYSVPNARTRKDKM
jgi:hypothetical protein